MASKGKAPAKKRKAAVPRVLTSALPTTQAIADAILKHVLPADAGVKHPASSMLLAAFRFVEQDARSRRARALRASLFNDSDAAAAGGGANPALSPAGGLDLGGGLQLPREFALRVLGHLPLRQLARLKRVSRSWLGVVTDPSLYTELTTAALPERITMTDLCNVIKAPEFSSLAKLQLPKRAKLKKTGAASLARAAPGLVALDTAWHRSWGTLYVREVSELMHAIPTITAVGIAAAPGNAVEIVKTFGARIKELHLMVRGHYSGGADDFFAAVAEHCKALVVLTFGDSSPNNGSRGNVTTKQLISVLDGCPSLRVLNLQYSTSKLDGWKLARHLDKQRVEQRLSLRLIRVGSDDTLFDEKLLRPAKPKNPTALDGWLKKPDAPDGSAASAASAALVASAALASGDAAPDEPTTEELERWSTMLPESHVEAVQRSQCFFVGSTGWRRLKHYRVVS